MCFADGIEVGSFGFMERYASAAAYQAVRSLQRFLFRLHQVHIPGATEQPPRRAVLLQRENKSLTSRLVLNERAAIAALERSGFVASVVVPSRLPLHELLAAFGAAQLLLTVHGAGMINMAFMRLQHAVVIEAFPAHFLYGTGFAPCNGFSAVVAPSFWREALAACE